jgi:hypothetical protein
MVMVLSSVEVQIYFDPEELRISPLRFAPVEMANGRVITQL